MKLTTLNSKSEITAKLLKEESILLTYRCLVALNDKWNTVSNIIISKVNEGYKVGYKSEETGIVIKVERFTTISELRKSIEY